MQRGQVNAWAAAVVLLCGGAWPWARQAWGWQRGTEGGGQFREVTGDSAFGYVTRNGETGRKYFPQPMCGGVAVLDYDGDGAMDLFFTNGAPLPGQRKTTGEFDFCLLRNRGGGVFEDRTGQAGVRGREMGYSLGTAAGDYDNDGRPDLFVAGAGRHLLLRNTGRGGFEDKTAGSGLDGKAKDLLSVGAAWLDFDQDGLLDLFVSNYTIWNPATDKRCTDAEGREIFCSPTYYPSVANSLYRNLGGGRFADVSAESGVAAARGKGMGIATADFDGNGWTDVLVINDTERNFLFLNQGGGKFREEALPRGVALNDDGVVVNGMGVDARDYDNDGWVDAFYNNLAGQMFGLFRNTGRGEFAYVSPQTRVSRLSQRFSGWSAGFIDYDNDGWKDLYSANGHVDYWGPNAAQRDTMFRNVEGRHFEDVSAGMGDGFAAAGYQRGAAFADLNNDGWMDLVVTRLNARPRILLNTKRQGNQWLVVELAGTAANRDGVGARVTLTTASGRKLYNHAGPSTGLLSSSDKRLHFGLGGETMVRLLEVEWPGGKRQTVREVAAGRHLRVEEPR